MLFSTTYVWLQAVIIIIPYKLLDPFPVSVITTLFLQIFGCSSRDYSPATRISTNLWRLELRLFLHTCRKETSAGLSYVVVVTNLQSSLKESDQIKESVDFDEIND
ncbi:hypothetical protein AVEN_259910-1 [Araneus ventricosus]|uniref:Uncharacterized protein n=1 Tax=Araneus ventricosus TaxID=182803 RepID=A0A4Y2IY48_ARAVE|nr:hypothetical protein AVEN_259910-1 [Araneus ventricosus]